MRNAATEPPSHPILPSHPPCASSLACLSSLRSLAFAQVAVKALQLLVLGSTAAASGKQLSLPLAGAEWWVQRRPTHRNLEFHFDVDSCLLHNSSRFRCPSIASILYLSDAGGPTAILHQAAAKGYLWGYRLSPGAAGRCDLIFPSRSLYAVFPGSLLHGVLPDLRHAGGPLGGQGVPTAAQAEGEDGMRTTLLVNWWFGEPPSSPCCAPVSDSMAESLLKSSVALAAPPGSGSDFGSQGETTLTHEVALQEFNLAARGSSAMQIESDLWLLGTHTPLSFFVPEPGSDPWKQRLNSAVTSMHHAHSLRTAFDA
mmetsp:Transcript_32553/g.92318  ORF Transcript_32553/g.92318 Transcript_32553/m.92318 type:complete len:313 (+) Transcript_32553:369-1307(+)